MNYRLLALAITALSSAHITTAAAQSVYVAPGGVYIGGGPVYVIPAPSNGNGTYVEPAYGYGYGVPEPRPYVAPTVVAPGVGYGVAAPYGLNGNGYGYRNGPPPPAYYNGDPNDIVSGDRVIGRDPDPFIRGGYPQLQLRIQIADPLPWSWAKFSKSRSSSVRAWTTSRCPFPRGLLNVSRLRLA